MKRLDFEEFRFELDRLAKSFGQRELSPYQLEGLFDEVQDLDVGDFRACVNHVIRTRERLPGNLVPVFRERSREFRGERELGLDLEDAAFRAWAQSEAGRIRHLEGEFTDEEALEAAREVHRAKRGTVESYFSILRREAERSGDSGFVERHKLIYGRAVLDQRRVRAKAQGGRTDDDAEE